MAHLVETVPAPLTEREAHAVMSSRALDYAHLVADYGTDHPFHDQWRAAYLEARTAWRKLAFAAEHDPVPEGLADRSIEAVRALAEVSP